MAVTQQDQALQMLAQLRVLDPSLSGEIGSPERKIIDTTAQALIDDRVDLQGLQSALDLNSKFGSNLDNFLALFGFSRQKATFATGFVTFSRITPSNTDIRIPTGRQMLAPAGDSLAQDQQYSTTFDVILPGDGVTTSVVAPVRANIAGTAGNVPPNTITEIVGTPILGITAVINEGAITGGSDQESDAQYKVRFTNTIFRNLAGTRDQYLALAVAAAYTTKATVIGPISRYREYVQVPPVDDASTYMPDGVTSLGGNGIAGQYTTALSEIPFSSYTYNTVPTFVTDDSTTPIPAFYREGVDFAMNTPPLNAGDTYRMFNTPTPLGGDPKSAQAQNQPNLTFLNVYQGTDANVQAVRAGQVLLFEHSYLSNASRNDVRNNVTNCVDIYVDGSNDINADTITTVPSSMFTFIDDPTNKAYFENYRRIGEPDHRPIIGNFLTPLFWQPVTSLPLQIVVNNVTYTLGIHYWPVEDVSNIGRTIRARSGIEWSTSIHGQAINDDPSQDPATFVGSIISAQPAGTPIDVFNYTYNKNIPDIQAALDKETQVTTDVLVHEATVRYFKGDISVIYTPGAAVSTVATNAQTALNSYLTSAYFGSIIQLGKWLNIIESVVGINNARWTSDIPGSKDLSRVYETDASGNPRTGAIIERFRPGTGAQSEIWHMYFTGNPTSGTFAIGYGGSATPNQNILSWTPTNLQSTLQTLTGSSGIPNMALTVSNSAGTPEDPLIINWGSTGTRTPFSVTTAFTTGDFIYDSDFILDDNELASLAINVATGDTVPGLILRPRAQNTWTRGG